jgi:transcriptional regulator with XRE-family HTH domain
LGELIGECHSTIGYWESTGKLPRSEVLVPLARALGVSVEDLLGENTQKRQTTLRGKAAQLFDAISKLPRRQQEKIFEILRPYVKEQIKGRIS